MQKINVIIILFFVLKSVNADGFLDLLKSYGVTFSYDIKITPLPTREEYDFIIVGSGSGGSVVANRLSENKEWKVLLLEAGQPEGIFNQVPILYAPMINTNYNWGYRIQRQENACFGMINGRCTWPRGKSLGGSSSINAMIHTRGNKLDYDLWESIGNKGWSYDKVLPYFIKSENFKVPVPHIGSYHGTDGPLCVQHIPYHSTLAREFLEAGKELLYDIVEYNGPRQIGFSYLQVNMDNGARCSASKAYLTVNRHNLDIVTHAFVTKILIDENKRAYGVQYVKNGITRMVRAEKEVILSAGTIDSAKLLMLSGIGPRDHLEEKKIEVIQDAKVGYNMYEHVAFWGAVFTVNASVTMNIKTLLSPSNAAQYIRNREGPFSTPIGGEAIAFIQTKYAIDERPDLELLFISAALSSDNGLDAKQAYGISDEVYNKVFKPLEWRDAFTIWPIVQQPKSHGRVKLRSKNPYHNPILQPNIFSHPYDIEIILEGIKHAINLTKTQPFQKYNAKLHNIKMPGCEFYKFASDDYFRCAIKTLPTMENHQMGTVKMGPKSDPDAVVDSELRVYGIKGLRVIDASIMPTMPVGHINAGIYMIGEKGADMIRRTWEC